MSTDGKNVINSIWKFHFQSCFTVARKAISSRAALPVMKDFKHADCIVCFPDANAFSQIVQSAVCLQVKINHFVPVLFRNQVAWFLRL